MTRHTKKHKSEHVHHPPVQKTPPHKDWRLWAIVGLMLIAMLGYIFTMDEALEPGGGEQPAMPAAP